MGQIQVYIPASEKPAPAPATGSDVPQRQMSSRTIAVPLKKAVIWGETLNWHVHCQHPDVKKIRLEFEPHHRDGQLSPMFRKNGANGPEPAEGDHEIVKSFPDAIDPAEPRTLNIWVQIPASPNKSKIRREKYTITCLDSNGNEVPGTKLDPEVITTDPGGD
jgi:hypothetical protein